MDNSLQVLEQRELLGIDFKIYGDVDNPLFLAKDVAEWIEYDLTSVHKLVATVDDIEKVRKNVPTLGGDQEMWFLTEDGLYEVLLQSRKPIAREFKKQVKQILKDIRRHGIYATDAVIENILNSPEFGIKVLTELKIEREKRVVLEGRLKAEKPKVIFANAVEASKSSILIGDLAKILKQNGADIGQKRLFEWLRKNEYLMKCGSSRNMPTQRSMEMEIFEVKESAITNSDGSIRVTKTTKVTGKGQIYFINLFAENQVAV